MLEAKEIRKLLVNYNRLKSFLVNLDSSIAYEKKRPSDDVISAMTLSQAVGGMPFPSVGTVSNKTADIAQSYLHFAQQEIKLMEQESRLIHNILSQLDCAIGSLNGLHKTIVTRYFFENIKCKELISVFGSLSEQRDERTIWRIIRKSLIEMSKIISISKTDYNYVVNQEHLHS